MLMLGPALFAPSSQQRDSLRHLVRRVPALLPATALPAAQLQCAGATALVFPRSPPLPHRHPMLVREVAPSGCSARGVPGQPQGPAVTEPPRTVPPALLLTPFSDAGVQQGSISGGGGSEHSRFCHYLESWLYI